MRFTAIGAAAGLLVISLGLAPTLQAQVHAQGSCWIQRDAVGSTWLHARGDSQCLLQFPGGCYRGMMMPDSLHCDFRSAPPESMPHGCAGAYDIDIRDPRGGCMMSGRMTFRLDLSLTLHYDPQVVAALGIPIADVVLIRRVSGGYEVVPGVVHDSEAALFRLSTSMPSPWYGVADRSNLPLAVTAETWGFVKTIYR